MVEDDESVHADGHVPHALHDGTRQADVLSPRQHFRVVDVVAVVGGIAVMLHDESGFAVLEQELYPLILILGFAEAAELEDPPGLAAVAIGVEATVVGCLSWREVHPVPVRLGDVVSGIEAFEGIPELDSMALGGSLGAVIALPSPRYSDYIFFTNTIITLLRVDQLLISDREK